MTLVFRPASLRNRLSLDPPMFFRGSAVSVASPFEGRARFAGT
jgi:hypothetical protein